MRTFSEQHKKKLSESHCGKVGEASSRWKGGRILTHGGYVAVRDVSNPMSGAFKYVKEHRLVMSEYLGRKLLRHEIVHHKNGIKTDNRLENLSILSRSEHNIEHNPDRNRNTFGRFTKQKKSYVC